MWPGMWTMWPAAGVMPINRCALGTARSGWATIQPRGCRGDLLRDDGDIAAAPTGEAARLPRRRQPVCHPRSTNANAREHQGFGVQSLQIGIVGPARGQLAHGVGIAAGICEVGTPGSGGFEPRAFAVNAGLRVAGSQARRLCGRIAELRSD
jgi:hypothetical protein